jgi:hypothetical protein
MSTFRNAIHGLIDKEVYVFLKDQPAKAKISKIIDDLVLLNLLEDKFGCSVLTVHIDHLILVDA